MDRTTEADAQAWLERQADHFMETMEFTSDIPPGVHGLGCGVVFDADADDPRLARIYERFEPGPRSFWCHLYDALLTTERAP